jgi:hypothetical protein
VRNIRETSSQRGALRGTFWAATWERSHIGQSQKSKRRTGGPSDLRGPNARPSAPFGWRRGHPSDIAGGHRSRSMSERTSSTRPETRPLDQHTATTAPDHGDYPRSAIDLGAAIRLFRRCARRGCARKASGTGVEEPCPDIARSRQARPRGGAASAETTSALLRDNPSNPLGA